MADTLPRYTGIATGLALVADLAASGRQRVTFARSRQRQDLVDVTGLLAGTDSKRINRGRRQDNCSNGE